MGVKVREKVQGSGVWWVFVNHKGKRISKKIGRDEENAYDIAKKIDAKLVLEELDLDKKEKSPTLTFKQYTDQWLETYVKSVRRLSTYQRYRDLLIRYAYPEIGSMPIDKITRGTVRDILLKLNGKGLSRSTIALMKDAISGSLSAALDSELIPVNPTKGLIKSLHIERDKREHLDPLTHEEVNLFLQTCLKHSPEYYPFFLCAFRTGLRLGELLALQWGDIDWNGRFIQVSRSYKLGKTTGTKTGKVRRADMSDQLIETLKGLLIRRKKDGLKMGLGEPPEVIFQQHGRPMEQNYIRRQFKRILKKAGLREIRIHDIRHTYASLLLSDGVTPVYVKEQLGHSSIQMTVDIYGHWIPNSNRGAVNRLDKYCSSDIETYPREEEIKEAINQSVPLDNPHFSAPQTHPAKTKEAQPTEIMPLPVFLVPKRGLEPLQGLLPTRP